MVKKWAMGAMIVLTACSITACSNPLVKKTPKDAYMSSITQFHSVDSYELKGDFNISATSEVDSLKTTKEAAAILNGSKLSLDAKVDVTNEKVSLTPSITFTEPEKKTISTTVIIDGKTKKATIGATSSADKPAVDLSKSYEDVINLAHHFLQDDEIFLNSVDPSAFVEKEVSEADKKNGISRIISLNIPKEKMNTQLKEGNTSLLSVIPLFSANKTFNGSTSSSTTIYLNKKNQIIKQDISTTADGEVDVNVKGTLSFIFTP